MSLKEVQENECFYDIENISKYLGLSTRKVKSMIKKREIPFYFFGDQFKFDVKAVAKWLEDKKVA